MSNDLRGITKENLLRIFPSALTRDKSVTALAESAAELLAARLAEIDKARVTANIDVLDNAVLDLLACDFKVDWWDPEYTVEEKQQTLKDSWQVHRTLGTKAAVERAISAIYPYTTLEEWFEYGGDPYHFRIRINLSDDYADPERMQRVLARMNYYKNLRSHNDRIQYFMVTTTRADAWAGGPGIREIVGTVVTAPPPVPPCGAVEVGTTIRSCGCGMRTPAVVAAQEPEYSGGVSAACAAAASVGIYQKFVTEVAGNETLE